jgi:hypothetical protein
MLLLRRYISQCWPLRSWIFAQFQWLGVALHPLKKNHEDTKSTHKDSSASASPRDASASNDIAFRIAKDTRRTLKVGCTRRQERFVYVAGLRKQSRPTYTRP